jgi:hypothetical protein
MGDNMTALLVLSSLYLVLRGWNHLGAWSPRTASILLLSGLVMGLGTGLKLTNATYALALCVALLVPPLPWRMRFTNAILYGSAVAAGVFASAGYWWLTMWERFGNPLFPQFNDIFRSPLALQAGVLDSSHVPRNAWEALFWPFIFTVDVKRVSEIALKQAILPALYLLAIVFAFVWLAERLSARQAPARLSPRARFLLVFGLVAYAAWLKLFGIYRYLVPLELLAPLMVWVLVERMAAPAHAAHIGAWIVALATLAVFPFATWGHGGWAAANFSARVPPIARPASTIVFIAHNHPPMGWLATFFPRGVRVISVGSGFPESPAYLERIRAAIAGRPGPHYVMLAAATNDRESGLRRKQAIARALGMTDDAESCGRLDRLLRRVRFQVQVKPVKPAFEAGHRCTLELQSQYVVDLAAQDQAIIRAGQENLARYGLKLDAASCRQYPAAVGTEPHPYHLCVVTP